ncbi:Uncharacterized protein GBIM_09411 [Gryllus bimaculatus]|nr:Uncharacterized protein GBIM_09411 [Gryllus bimaculatus]
MSDIVTKDTSSSGRSLSMDLNGVSMPYPACLPLEDQGVRTGVREPCTSCRCGPSCSCRRPLEFPRRVLALPPVRSAAALYARAKESHASVACALTAAEVAALVAAAPARLVMRPLRGALATPVYVADLLLCKALDLAQRVLPCIAQTPQKTCRDVALCTCVLPAGACLFSARAVCRGARLCLCDVPAAAVGAPAVAACGLAELCLCSAPRAACCPPAHVAATAARGALRDTHALLRDVSFAANYCSANVNAQ